MFRIDKKWLMHTKFGIDNVEMLSIYETVKFYYVAIYYQWETTFDTHFFYLNTKSK